MKPWRPQSRRGSTQQQPKREGQETSGSSEQVNLGGDGVGLISSSVEVEVPSLPSRAQPLSTQSNGLEWVFQRSSSGFTVAQGELFPYLRMCIC